VSGNSEEYESIISDLRAKLKAAEGAKIAVVSDRDELEANYHDCIYERDRLQAEAKQMREEIRTCIYMTDRYNPAKEGTSLMHFAGTYERLADDHARLQAEVARLEKNANPLVQLHEDGTITQLDPVQLRTRIAELEACLKDLANNFDCDRVAHKYGTICHACRAKALLGEVED